MIQWTAHNGRVRALGYSPDGAMLVSGGDDHSLCVWDPVSGERRADIRHEFQSIEFLTFRPDGRLLAFAIGRPLVVVCDPASLRDGSLAGAITEPTWGADVSSLAFSPDGRILVSAGALAGAATRATLWDVAAFKRNRQSDEPDPRIDALDIQNNGWLAAAYAKDGRAIALGGSRGLIVLWPYPLPWAYLSTRDEPSDSVACDRYVRQSRVAEVRAGDGGPVWRIAFSPDGTTLAAALANVVVLWDYSHPGEEPPVVSNRRLLRGHARAVRSLAFASDGRTIATASLDGTLRIWDTREASELSCLDAGAGELWSLALAPDGMTVAVGGERGDVINVDVDERP